MADAPVVPAAPAAAQPAAAPAPASPGAAAPAVVPAVPGNTIATAAPAAPAAVEMPADFAGGAEAWGKLDDAGKSAAATAASEKATTESKARTDAFAQAVGKDAKLAAYNALSAEEKATAFKALNEDQRKELGVEDPAIPVYTDFKLPEGVTIDPDGMKAATDLFKDSRLSQEQAQKFIDLAVSREQAAANRTLQAFVDTRTKWVSEIKSDPEIGGQNLEKTQGYCKTLIDRLNVPGLGEALDLTGAGDNPAIVKAFARLGQMVSEDRFRPGASAPSDGAGRTPNYYGDTGPKGSTP